MNSIVFAVSIVLLAPALASADVVDKSAGGFTLRTVFTVPGPPETAYATVVNIKAWWDKAHTYSGDANNMSIAAMPGGCFCETLPGGGVQHGTVALAWPGRTLRIISALGPLQELGVTGALSWQFEKAPEGTKITFTYAVGGYAPAGLDKLAELVDGVLMQQMKSLKTFADTRR